MALPMAAWRLTYTTGRWLALSGPTSLVIMMAPPASVSGLVADLWKGTLETRTPDALFEFVAGEGISNMPHFGAFFWDSKGLHGISRGDVQVVDAASGDVVIDGSASVTWQEDQLDAERTYSISLEAIDDGEERPTLPLVVGAALVSSITLTTAKDQLLRFPSSEQLGVLGKIPVLGLRPRQRRAVAQRAAGPMTEAEATAPEAAGQAEQLPPAEQPEQAPVPEQPEQGEGQAPVPEQPEQGEGQVPAAEQPDMQAPSAPPAPPVPGAPGIGAPGVAAPLPPTSLPGAPAPEAPGAGPSPVPSEPSPEPVAEPPASVPSAPEPAHRPSAPDPLAEPSIPGPGPQDITEPEMPAVTDAPAEPPSPEAPEPQGSGPPPDDLDADTDGDFEAIPFDPSTLSEVPSATSPASAPEAAHGRYQAMPPVPPAPMPASGASAPQVPGSGPSAAPFSAPSAPSAPPPGAGPQSGRSSPVVVPGQFGEVEEEDGTIFSTGLAATHKPAAPESEPDPQVLAVPCAQGHPNPQGARNCRICQAPVDASNPRLVRRPVLAGVNTNQGEFADVVSAVIVGRSPDLAHGPGDSYLMRVPSPGNDISRSHLKIATKDWNVVVTDLHSTNGTTVRPVGEPEFELRDGRSVQVELGTILDLGDGVSLRIEPPRGR